MNIEILRDESPESPREWCNLGTFFTKHRRYQSPDPYPDMYPPEDSIALPVYMYDHSGVTYATTPFSCPWDSGQVGFIFVTREKIRDEFGDNWTVEQIEKYLEDEVKIYNQWVNGEVYGFVNHDTGDSCWGFYSEEEAMEHAHH